MKFYLIPKIEGVMRNETQVHEFSDTLDQCGLNDIPARGDRFTWCNKRKGDALIWSRLDRFICNHEWHVRFYEAIVENLGFFGSDHRPVDVILKPVRTRFLILIERDSRKWFLEEDFNAIFNRSWEGSHEDLSLPQRLSFCSMNLSSWAGRKFEHFEMNLCQLRKDLDSLMTSSHSHNHHALIQELKRKIERLSDQEEIHWKQRARVNWLQSGIAIQICHA